MLPQFSLPPLIAALLMLMQVGFALVTTGLCRARNAGQIVTANLMIMVTSILGFRLCGCFVMFGLHPRPDAGEVLLMGLLVSIAAVIPAGAMAERWSFRNLVCYGFFAGALPIALMGRWIWAGGWLAHLELGHGVIDFAGSSVIHMSAGVIALVGAYMIGPRAGKYARDGRPRPMPGHNLVFVCAGALILFAGWFGFNSAMAMGQEQLAVICSNTLFAAVAGAFAAYATTVFKFGKPDPSMICNGLLAGLVSICASCAFVNSPSAIVIGAVAGILAVHFVLLFETKFKIDDPVGAISVHGVGGAWGLLSVGLFAKNAAVSGAFGKFLGGPINDWAQLAAQCVGILVCLIVVGLLAIIWFNVSNRIVPMRARRDFEVGGLDLPETGAECYPDFHLTDKGSGGEGRQ